MYDMHTQPKKIASKYEQKKICNEQGSRFLKNTDKK